MLELNNLEIGNGALLYKTGVVQLIPGQLTILFGANGAGKSTLLDAIAVGALRTGDVLLKGNSLKALTPSKRARLVSLVESRFYGNDYMSVTEYIQLGRSPHTGFSGRLSEADKQVVQAIADRIGINHLLDQSTETLSDGERQRVSIARALIQETPIVLLDEPTSFLDYPNKRTLLQLLKEIAHSEQKIILLVSHDLELCLEYGDCFLLINPVEKQLNLSRECTMEDVIAVAFPDRVV